MCIRETAASKRCGGFFYEIYINYHLHKKKHNAIIKYIKALANESQRESQSRLGFQWAFLPLFMVRTITEERGTDGGR